MSRLQISRIFKQVTMSFFVSDDGCNSEVIGTLAWLIRCCNAPHKRDRKTGKARLDSYNYRNDYKETR